jgi:hypothetical protein
MCPGVPERNSKFCSFANLCPEMVVLKEEDRLFNIVLLGDVRNQRAFV